MAGSGESDKQGPLARWRDGRRRKKALKGDSPERMEEHHTPERDWGERAIHASPGGQRHSTFKGDRR